MGKLGCIVLLAGVLGFAIPFSLAEGVGENETDVSKDITNEMFVGVRSKGEYLCQIGHQQLSFGFPELFISFHPINENEFVEADSGLLEAFGLSYEDYRSLFYGEQPVEAFASEVGYRYILSAHSEGRKRIVKISGVTKVDQNRRSEAEILLINHQIERVRITKFSKTFFKTWDKTFEDSCFSFKRN